MALMASLTFTPQRNADVTPYVPEVGGLLHHCVLSLPNGVARLQGRREPQQLGPVERREQSAYRQLLGLGDLSQPEVHGAVQAARRRTGSSSSASTPRFEAHRVALLALAGVDPSEIARRVGHASVAFTYDRYGHLLPEVDKQRRSSSRQSVRPPAFSEP